MAISLLKIPGKPVGGAPLVSWTPSGGNGQMEQDIILNTSYTAALTTTFITEEASGSVTWKGALSFWPFGDLLKGTLAEL